MWCCEGAIAIFGCVYVAAWNMQGQRTTAVLTEALKVSQLSDLSLKVHSNFYPTGFPFLKRSLNSPFLFFIITTTSVVPPTQRSQKHCWVIIPYTPLIVFSIFSIEMSILRKRGLFWPAVLHY